MVRMICLVVCVSGIISADQAPQEHGEGIEEMAKNGYIVIDNLFAKMQTSIAAKEDIMDPQWLQQRTEIKEIQYLLSDASILCNFDQRAANELPQLLQEYLKNKIREEAEKIFAIYGVSVKDVNNFYELSHIICKVGYGNRCGRMMREIKEENFDCVLKLKMQKIARKQLRKEQARMLRESLVLGVR